MRGHPRGRGASLKGAAAEEGGDKFERAPAEGWGHRGKAVLGTRWERGNVEAG